jgi:hypothetical protein
MAAVPLLFVACGLTLAAAAPAVDASASSFKFQQVPITYHGGHTDYWNVMTFDVVFTEDLYIDYGGSLTRIDQLPMDVPLGEFHSASEVPVYTYPRQVALGGSFRITAAENAQCRRGLPVPGHAWWRKHLKNVNEVDPHDPHDRADSGFPSLTGQPPWAAMGGTLIEGSCTSSFANGDGEGGGPPPVCEPGPVPDLGGDGGCAGVADFTACPAWMALRMQSWEASGSSDRSYFCHAEQCVASISAGGPPRYMAIALPSTEDALFSFMTQVSGGFPRLNTGTPRTLKLAVVLPFSQHGEDFWFAENLIECGFKIQINELTVASTKFGTLPEGTYPLTPAKLKGADGSLATGSLNLAGSRFADATATIARCDYDRYMDMTHTPTHRLPPPHALPPAPPALSPRLFAHATLSHRLDLAQVPSHGTKPLWSHRRLQERRESAGSPAAPEHQVGDDEPPGPRTVQGAHELSGHDRPSHADCRGDAHVSTARVHGLGERRQEPRLGGRLQVQPRPAAPDMLPSEPCAAAGDAAVRFAGGGDPVHVRQPLRDSAGGPPSPTPDPSHAHPHAHPHAPPTPPTPPTPRPYSNRNKHWLEELKAKEIYGVNKMAVWCLV